MENICNYTKFTNVSRVKYAVYPLYLSGNIADSPRFTGSHESNPTLVLEMITKYISECKIASYSKYQMCNWE